MSLDHLLDAIVDVLAVEDAVALGVDDLALLVHDVVVLEDVLSGGEVHRLDLALRALDRLADEARLDGHVVGDLRALHQPLMRSIRSPPNRRMRSSSSER